MKTKKKFNVGQTVYLKPINNLKRRTEEIFTGTIKVLGRKYVGIECDKYFKFSEFVIDTMCERSYYSPDYEVYLNYGDAENSSKKPIEKRKTIDLISDLNYKDLLKVQEFIINL